MTFAPNFSIGTYLPETIDIPKDEGKLQDYLKSRLEEILRSINKKDIASYEQVEQLCGQQFYGASPQTKRYVFRKVFPIPAIAIGAVLNIPHNIAGLTAFTRIYGTIVTSVPDDRPLPYVDAAVVTNQVSVLRNGANLVIQNGATAPAITSGLLVVEYFRN